MDHLDADDTFFNLDMRDDQVVQSFDELDNDEIIINKREKRRIAMRQYRLNKKNGIVGKRGRKPGVKLTPKVTPGSHDSWDDIIPRESPVKGVGGVHRRFMEIDKPMRERMVHIVVYSSQLAQKLMDSKPNYGWCLCRNENGSHKHLHFITEEYNYYRDIYKHQIHMGDREKVCRCMPILCERHLIRAVHYVGCDRATNKRYKNVYFDGQEHHHYNCHGLFPKHSNTDCSKIVDFTINKFCSKEPHECDCFEDVRAINKRKEIIKSIPLITDRTKAYKSLRREYNRKLYYKNALIHDATEHENANGCCSTAPTTDEPTQNNGPPFTIQEISLD